MSHPADLDLASAQTRPVLKSPLPGLLRLYRPGFGGPLVCLSYIFVIYIIFSGWNSRVEQPLTAESGLGYALGIVGGCLMLLLLLYPLRKHLRMMRRLGSVKSWFRMHMMFGVLGPVCILFHCGFQLGSLNSNVALLSMVVVATSGLVGRYFYTRIHHGLYGHKATMEELVRHSALIEDNLHSVLSGYPAVTGRIQAFEKQAFKKAGGPFSSLLRLASLGIRTWLLYLSLTRNIPRDIGTGDRKTILRYLGARLENIRKIAGFRFYERLFSLWHVLHLPLFMMLILSGITHVIAVHMY